MSGPTDFVVPAIILKLHGWMPVIYRRVQENYGVRFGVGILCALLFLFWIYVKRLVDCIEFVSLVASLIGYTLIVINCFFRNYISLLLLWLFSIFFVTRTEETEEQNVKEGLESNVTQPEVKKQSSTVTRLMNAEKFLKLFQTLLYEEETLGTESESIDEKVWKLKTATKELKKVQIFIDSLNTKVLYSFHSPMSERRRLQDLIEKFEHTKTYMELRRYMLNMVQRQLLVFTGKGMALKIWLSEALEFQEELHSKICSSHSEIQQHFLLLQGIIKDSKVVAEKLAEYEQSARSLTTTLREMSACSGIFHKALEGTNRQNEIRKWHDMLPVSVTEEATQVAQRFSTVTKLNECYQNHLDGLQQRVLQQFKGVTMQEDSKSAVVSGL